MLHIDVCLFKTNKNKKRKELDFKQLLGYQIWHFLKCLCEKTLLGSNMTKLWNSSNISIVHYIREWLIRNTKFDVRHGDGALGDVCWQDDLAESFLGSDERPRLFLRCDGRVQGNDYQPYDLKVISVHYSFFYNHKVVLWRCSDKRCSSDKD